MALDVLAALSQVGSQDGLISLVCAGKAQSSECRPSLIARGCAGRAQPSDSQNGLSALGRAGSAQSSAFQNRLIAHGCFFFDSSRQVVQPDA